MSTGSLIFCSLLAVACGFLIQQTVETLLNTSLTLLPFKIQTVR
ncbi:hypothetical protein GvMRE_I1g733 [endosymbiont GvMRE of Glomus versiforme]|nr:hypothetical protein GvMRE_Ic1g98 [endosymbiont GvMRE of Glomus versiforme]RHZ36649.1 hypothetical protein GvMRE_I2g549 [endosymbiont GvMRE of Glomus versiforme]RHZ37424.1 hypothetical protein GvMRE_I1g733 [endosymbiont GvMRE of Glomus versiforme]